MPASSKSTLASSGEAAEQGFSPTITAEGTALCPFKQPDNWIEIELYDHEGQPCADEPYRITLADGTRLEDLRLDAKGRARHERIPVGSCLVEFPEREPLAPEDDLSDALELELLDEHGEPAADEPYLVVLADGSQHEGRLDKRGKLRIDGAPAGFFRLYLPERPHYVWEPDSPEHDGQPDSEGERR